jgi:polyisoprenyl-phosphate glycosyltransferase
MGASGYLSGWDTKDSRKNSKGIRSGLTVSKLSVIVPTYNEVENVEAMCYALRDLFSAQLSQYDYEIIFIDNCSSDGTRAKLERLCSADNRVKAIFNAKNFGQFNSPYYGMLQSTGDATILVAADFQDPVEMIPKFVSGWEEGYQIVCGVKKASQESKLVYFLRTCYYKFIKKLSRVEQIEHFTGFGLYDKSFIDVLRGLDDRTPFLRGLVAELGGSRKEIPYEQPRRRAGKTHNNWYTLYDAAMLSITSYTKIGLRIATIIGTLFSIIGFLVALIYLILKLIYWDRFVAGQAPLLIGVFLMGSIQMLFIGFLGEYVLSINARVLRRPLVIEEKRINFTKDA